MRNISVLIVDQARKDDIGSLVNAGFVVGLTAGRMVPEETFGPDVTDGEGMKHTSLTNIGHYVRKASQSKLRTLRREFAGMPGVVVTDYTDAAAPSNYDEYAATLASQSGESITYRMVHVYGPEEIVAPLTKNLSRL